MQFRLVCTCLSALIISCYAPAQVAQFTDNQTWQAAVDGEYSTIDFTDQADKTLITNQYRNLGVTFEGWAQIWNTGAFVTDQWGIWGTNGLRVKFDTPQNWVAVDFPGAIRLNLYRNGTSFYTGTYYNLGGYGHFAGIVSQQAFDEVYFDRLPPVPIYAFVDNLYWGAAVPAPGAVALFVLAGISPRRRRRRA